MSKQRRRWGWWPLGLILVGLGTLAFFEERAHLTTGGRMVAQLAGVLIIYGLLFVWLHTSQGAYLQETYEDLARSRTSTTELEPEPGQNVAPDGALDPVPSLPMAREAPLLGSRHTTVED